MSTEKKPRGIWWKSLLAAALCLPLGATFVHQVEPELAASASEEPINIALLGIGGEGHQGGNLADSIMVASVRGEHAVLLSVPRDLYIDIDGQREGRINAAHAIGEARSADGIALMTRALEGTLGIPIHHHVRVDFEGFVKAVDAVGGIVVRFDKPLNDSHFANEYGVLEFAAGDHLLDGRSALYVARSRMTSRRGDFDRAERQRAIIDGFKNRLLSGDVLTSPSALTQIIAAAGTHLASSLSAYDMWAAYHVARKVKHIDSVGLGDIDGLLRPERINGAEVLVPASGDLADIRHFVSRLVNG